MENELKPNISVEKEKRQETIALSPEEVEYFKKLEEMTIYGDSGIVFSRGVEGGYDLRVHGVTITDDDGLQPNKYTNQRPNSFGMRLKHFLLVPRDDPREGIDIRIGGKFDPLKLNVRGLMIPDNNSNIIEAGDGKTVDGYYIIRGGKVYLSEDGRADKAESVKVELIGEPDDEGRYR